MAARKRALSISLAQYDCEGKLIEEGREGGQEGGKGGKLPGFPRILPEGSRTRSSLCLNRDRSGRSEIAKACPGPR